MKSKKGENVKFILESLLNGVDHLATLMEPFGNIKARRKYWGPPKLNREQISGRKFYNAFYYLRRHKMIYVYYKNHQMYFRLTEDGKKKARKYKIDDLKIKKPKKWDKMWRILIFDIEDKHKIKREALRSKLKQLGLYQLQESVWVFPYDFKKQIDILRDFFGLTKAEMKIIEARKIEEDAFAREYFDI